MSEKIKGNLIVGQSGGPTAVINSSLCGVIQEAQKHSQIQNIYGMLNGVQGLLEGKIIDLGRQKTSIIEGLKRTPAAALGSCRHKLSAEDYNRILDIFKAHNIRYFLYIGGNDSMDTAHRVEQLAKSTGYELRCIGIPKTVDNDLEVTDHCPGYGSVARWNAIATKDAGRDTEAIGIVDKVKIIETMGRDAGWITAATALAKDSDDSAPHLVYLPERPFSEEKFLADVESVYRKFGHVLVAVCEGLKDKDGKYITASDRAIDTDRFGHKQLGGVADYLCNIIANNLKLKARFDKAGTIQRSSMVCVSKTDLKEAYMVGVKAVKYTLKGISDHMVTLVRESNAPYKCVTGLAKLEDVANAQKQVPDHFINTEGNFVTEAFIEYAKPLIGSPLPEYVRIERIPVGK